MEESPYTMAVKLLSGSLGSSISPARSTIIILGFGFGFFLFLLGPSNKMNEGNVIHVSSSLPVIDIRLFGPVTLM